MRKILAAVLTAVIMTGCGAVEIEGDTSASPARPAPEPKAELYIRELIEPEEISEPEIVTEQEPDKEAPEEISVPETEAETEQNAQKAEETEISDSEIETEIEEEEDDGAVNEGAEHEQAPEDDAGGDPEPAADGSGEAGTDEGLCERPDSEQPAMHLWGVCTITHYCPCSQCCGSWAGGATASGTTPTAGRTVAADLPFGTRLMINGHKYVVEDRGVGGMWVDIFVNGHQEALDLGMYQTEVYIID